jgi:hypothetical protein
MLVRKTLVAFTCKQLSNLSNVRSKLLPIHQLVIEDSLIARKLLHHFSWSENACKMLVPIHQK